MEAQVVCRNIYRRGKRCDELGLFVNSPGEQRVVYWV